MMLRSTQSSPACAKSFVERFAGHRHAIEMEQVLQFAQQRAHATRGKEIFHVTIANRFQVHQHRRRIGQFVEALQRYGIPARPAIAVK